MIYILVSTVAVVIRIIIIGHGNRRHVAVVIP